VLVVVGDTPYATADGRLHTFAALAKQLDVWFAEFDEVRVAAHLLPGPPPAGYAPLASDRVELVELRSGGGAGLRAKLGVVAQLLGWARTLVPLLRGADAVHLRTPCNVTLLAIPLARVLCRRRYAIYADNWEPLGVEPTSYRIQRAMLRRWGGVVHAYAPPGDDVPANVRPNLSPSFTAAELDRLAPVVEARIEGQRLDPPAQRPLRLCCVGTFSPRKNQTGLIRAAKVLVDGGVEVDLRFAGTGRTLEADRALVSELGLDASVTFLGELDHEAVRDLFAWADASALVSQAEGFGKVLLESMAVGCPVVCGRGRMQQMIIGDGERGRQADPANPDSIAAALADLRSLDPEAREAMSRSCADHARRWTTDAFADEIHHITRSIWGFAPR
jgi:glycosyltransferase involved in cell wall biosynthesis